MKKQHGFVLVGLLIGLVISILCILAVLSVYRGSVHVGVDSRIATNHDAQLQNGLTVAQKQILNAGYGLEDGENIITKSNLVINQFGRNEMVKGVLWKYKADGVIYCKGLAEVSNQDNTKRQLIFVKAITNCNATAKLGDLGWKHDSVIASLHDYSSGKTNPSQITFTLEDSSCTPYGAGRILTARPNKVLKISARTSSQSQNSSLGTVRVETCLMNISP